MTIAIRLFLFIIILHVKAKRKQAFVAPNMSMYLFVTEPIVNPL